MNEPKLTPDQYAELIKQAKPHIIALEDEITRLGYGTLEVKMEVRAGVVAKMSFFEQRTWLKDHE